MKVCVFEWLVGGGGIGDWTPVDSSDPMLMQGAAMFSAITCDLLDGGHEVHTLVHPEMEHALADLTRWRSKTRFVELPPDRDFSGLAKAAFGTPDRLIEHLIRISCGCDWIVVIAPESDGILNACTSALETNGISMVTGDASFIARCSDKNRTQRWLQNAGVAVPAGQPVNQRSDVIAFFDRHAASPIVVKPALGAGSDDVRIISNRTAIENWNPSPGDWRVEQHVKGTALSVIVARRGETFRTLPATGQVFANDLSDQSTRAFDCGANDIGHYCRTIYPLPPDMAQRATTLAMQTAKALPDWQGIIGIDMILPVVGPAVVVDVNPRLTMSWTALPKSFRSQVVRFLFSDGPENS